MFPSKRYFYQLIASVNSHSTPISISRRCKTFEHIKEHCLIACLCSSGDWLWSDKTSCPWTATPENRVHGLRGQSNIYRTITICRKPTKLFINKPPDIISERWWCATAVIIWQLSQSSLICQFWPSKQWKIDPFIFMPIRLCCSPCRHDRHFAGMSNHWWCNGPRFDTL